MPTLMSMPIEGARNQCERESIFQSLQLDQLRSAVSHVDGEKFCTSEDRQKEWEVEKRRSQMGC